MALDCVVIGPNKSLSHSRKPLVRHANGSGVTAEFFRWMVQREYVHWKGCEWLTAPEVFSKGRLGNDAHSSYDPAETPSLGCILLTNFLRQNGRSVDWIGCFDFDLDKLRRLLIEEDPLIVAITTTVYLDFYPVTEIADFVRSVNPEVRICVGGPLVRGYRVRSGDEALCSALETAGVDYAILESEGEATLLKLIDVLHAGTSVTSVPNLFHKNGVGFEYTRQEIENNPLQKIAINWDNFSREELGTSVWMRTALSCAFKCAFCNYPVFMGPLRTHSVEAVERELRQLDSKGVQFVNFVDDTFNVPIERFEQLLKMMERNSFEFRWYSYLRVSNIRSNETFDRMQATGCEGVFLGIESVDEQVLKNMKKGAKIDQYRRGIQELNKRGLWTKVSMITGFPGETWDSIERSIQFLEETRPTFVHVSPFTYNHKTPVHEEREKYGLQGNGCDWSHNTMNTLEAIDGAELYFQRLKDSAWLPDYNFALWSLCYFRSLGMTRNQVLEFCQHIARLIDLNDTDSESTERRTAEHRIENFLRSLDIREPRYELVTSH